MIDDPKLQTYGVYRHPSATAHLGPSLEPWQIFASNDDDAVVQLRSQARLRLAREGHTPEDMITMNGPDGALIRHWTLAELAR